MENFGSKCWKPNSGGLEQLVTNWRGEGREVERRRAGWMLHCPQLLPSCMFPYVLHLEEETFLLFAEVAPENIPQPQNHTVGGMVASIVHRVVPVGEGVGRGGGAGGQGGEEGRGRRSKVVGVVLHYLTTTMHDNTS